MNQLQKNLKWLHCSQNRGLNNEALAALKGLKELEHIDIGGIPSINDQGLVHLVKMKNLKTLAYSGTAITEAGIDKLREFIPDLNRNRSQDSSAAKDSN